MFQDQQLQLPAFPRTIFNQTQQQEDIIQLEEASVKEIFVEGDGRSSSQQDSTSLASLVKEIVEGGDGRSTSQPDTTSLVILLGGSLLLFLFYLGLKYYTTDSFRWIQDRIYLRGKAYFFWPGAVRATVESQRRGRFHLGREGQAPQCLAWLLLLPGPVPLPFTPSFMPFSLSLRRLSIPVL